MTKETEKIQNNASISQTTDEVNPKLIALVADQITALNSTIVKFIIAMVILMVLCLVSTISNIVVYTKMTSIEHDNNLTKKYVWELKRSLDLSFSSERSEKVD